MKLFGRRGGETSESASARDGSGWSELQRQSEAMERERSNERRQQRKIIRFLMTGDVDVFGQNNVVLEEYERKSIDHIIASDGFDYDMKRWTISKISNNVHLRGEEAVFDDAIANDAASRCLLAMASGRGAEHYRVTSADDVRRLVKKYPTPADFEDESENVLNSLRYNEPQVFGSYERKMNTLKRAIYGKQDEYFHALNNLEREAHEKMRRPEYLMTGLSERESVEILRRSRCEGDAYYGRRGQVLTNNDLWKNDLAPAYKVEFGGASIALSKQYLINGDGREAVMAYVDSPRGTIMRSYYRSSSQGVWRLLPDYVNRPNKGCWYGKGQNEQSMVLPGELQSALSIVSRQKPANVRGVNSEFFFCGTAKYYSSIDEYSKALNSGQLRGSVYQELAREPSYTLTEYSYEDKSNPLKLDVKGGQAPDFAIEKDSWKIHSKTYGDVTMRTYKSKDKKLKYSMCEDRLGRSWVGNVETNAVINSAGLRSQWVEVGDLGTPLYEYASQTGGYGDKNDKRGEYESMWRYLAQSPLIERFMNRKKR